MTDTDTMTCGVCVAPGDFELRERQRPSKARPGWALVDVQVVGICGTDYHIFEGKHPFLEYPRVIGHEISGVLVEDVQGMAAGTLVAINPYLSCGDCRACRKSKPNCCSKIAVLGVHKDGAMCDRIEVPISNLFPADGLTDIQAAMVEFLAIGAHAVARAQMSAGDRVLVSGAGPIGIGTALFALIAGADVHLLDIDAGRLAMVKDKFGFEHTHTNVSDALNGELADGYDVVFDATGNVTSMENGFQLLAHGSSYVLVSVVKGSVTFDDAEFHKRETRVIGSRNALRSDFETVADALRNGLIDSDVICSEVLTLSDFANRFAAMASDRSGLIKACVRIAG